MNQQDARSFILALNAVVGYVPPMLMTQVTASPVCKLIEQIANSDQATQGGITGQVPPAERPNKPRAVDG